MRKSILLSAIGALMLGSCASVDFHALNPQGTDTVGPAGLRYYLPMPYLLVTEIPDRWAQQSTADVGQYGTVGSLSPGQETAGAPAAPIAPNATPAIVKGGTNQLPIGLGSSVAVAGGVAAKASGPAASASDTKGAAPAATDPPASSVGNDVSYSHQIREYQVKLVYLPDLSHPMAMTMTTGFGSASIQPTLVDGWMLASLQASADSNAAAVLSSLASVITAQKPTAAAAPSTAASGAAKAVAGGKLPDRGLPPGLYAFDFDKSSGILKRLCAVAFFSADVGVVKECGRTETALAVKAAAFGAVAAAEK